MVDIRKVIIIFVIAVLFSVLVFSTIEAIYPSPKYEDYCPNNPKTGPLRSDGLIAKNCTALIVPEEEVTSCEEKHGYIEYVHDSDGCAQSYRCQTCNNDFQQASDQHNRYVFYISSLLALIAVFIGLYLPASNNPLNEWVGTGFMLGGAFIMLFVTASAYSSLDRLVRPIIMFIELLLVIFVAYKKIGNLRTDPIKRKK
ncbi:hypothetical protein J4460_05015 [Candidatus Woesearchaeota archaeon]|nr:hypothetical protein [Candidatus Woesearchaeota archaeon]HIH38048.1 hypothetical protein [Candidatus Woesearchaeota archaeon]HIH48567.1 hypothetical protein [Candidatus Woesearchaeota archaeon]HIJ04252.1 hypothetical protein [Candidatus Woesearchaeota archaeon]